MRKRALLLGIHASPPQQLKWIYYLAPLVIVLIGYQIVSTVYLAANPGGRIIPSFAMMAARIWDLAFTLDSRTHTYLLWSDTAASITRFAIGLAAAAIVGLLLGLNIALFPGLQYLVLPGVVLCSFIPMLAILPILLIVVGIGEVMKILLIFLGVVFFITRDIYAAATEVPQELLVKARTLGATELALVYRVVLPMVMPRLFETVRQSLGPAWLFLMAGEYIAATEGLGYRIYIVRRYLDMAAIIPYVLWITALAFSIYYLMMYLQSRFYPWKQ